MACYKMVRRGKGICSGGHLILALAFLTVLQYGVDHQEQKFSLRPVKMLSAWLWEGESLRNNDCSIIAPQENERIGSDMKKKACNQH